jgi:hypothetical protein
MNSGGEYSGGGECGCRGRQHDPSCHRRGAVTTPAGGRGSRSSRSSRSSSSSSGSSSRSRRSVRFAAQQALGLRVGAVPVMSSAVNGVVNDAVGSEGGSSGGGGDGGSSSGSSKGSESVVNPSSSSTASADPSTPQNRAVGSPVNRAVGIPVNRAFGSPVHSPSGTVQYSLVVTEVQAGGQAEALGVRVGHAVVGAGGLPMQEAMRSPVDEAGSISIVLTVLTMHSLCTHSALTLHSLCTHCGPTRESCGVQ